MTVRDLGEGVAEPGIWIVIVQPAGLDQRGDPRPTLAALVVTGEQSVFARQPLGADPVLDEIVVGLYAAVIGKHRQPLPVLGDIGECLTETAFSREAVPLRPEPSMEVVQEWFCPLPPYCQSFVSGLSTDLAFNIVEKADPTQPLFGEKRFAGDFGFFAASNKIDGDLAHQDHTS